jgi:transcriptional regulator with AAA-type ATPase domain
MSLFSAADRPVAEALGRLVHTNPFLPDWVEAERQVLGARFREGPAAYSRQAFWSEGYYHPNVLAVVERLDTLVRQARERLDEGGTSAAELSLYQDLALYQLYQLHGDGLTESAREGRPQAQPAGESLRALWENFQRDFHHYMPPERTFPTPYRPEHVFGFFFQMRRAFVQIYDHIVGGSRPAARLRAAIWQSVFTHDLHRYHRSLHHRMRDFPTLITGPSGTGKELVARAVARSQFIPFDTRRHRFGPDLDKLFFPLNLSALAPTLVESELFGHCKGAFTGAVADRAGWLEQCGPYGAVFLDEVGEVDPAIQVKLLRVLQSRQFERLGETKSRAFAGKLLAATNRDLAAEIRSGCFRLDFYYRLCTDQITTPTLREQLEDHPADLHNLVLFITGEALGDTTWGEPSAETQTLAHEVVRWIEQNLGPGYPWPGNFRELGQCVRSVIIRRDYRPLPSNSAEDGEGGQDLASAVAAGALTAAELERRYYTLVYEQAGSSYQRAAKMLGIDWRTVKAKLDPPPTAGAKTGT